MIKNKHIRRYYQKNNSKILAQQAVYRRERNRSFGGKKVSLYKNIKTRVDYHPNYKHRELLFSFEDFLLFLKGNTHYKKHFYRWKKSGWLKKFSPSVDRIDNKKDYTIDNIQIISMSENAKKGAY
jgi:hypothetical protein